jgi:hypothetical protein
MKLSSVMRRITEGPTSTGLMQPGRGDRGGTLRGAGSRLGSSPRPGAGGLRRGKSTDLLLGKVIDGAREKAPDLTVKRIDLIDRDIRHCRNGLACRDTKKPGPAARCSIHAGALEHRGAERYFARALELGRKLAS